MRGDRFNTRGDNFEMGGGSLSQRITGVGVEFVDQVELL